MKKSNIPIVIYLVLNMIIVAIGMEIIIGLMNGTGDIIAASSMSESNGARVALNFSLAILIGVAVYLVCLAIALSPLGEWIVRLQNGCHKIERKEQIDLLEPIFREVYDKAKKLDSSIPEDVQLFICEGESANAFATGRKTVCVTEGLLNQPVDQIKATLGHEFGHLAHKDTDMILVVSVGNLLVNIIVWLVQVAIMVFGGVSKFCTTVFCDIAGGAAGVGWMGKIMGKMFSAFFTAICMALSFIIIRIFFKGWTKLGFWLVQKASRDNEFEADEFSFNLGYGVALCELLDSIGAGEAPEGLFAALSKSHPPKDSRIAKLQEMGCTYRATYGAQ